MHGAFTQVVLVVGEVWVDHNLVHHHVLLLPRLLRSESAISAFLNLKACKAQDAIAISKSETITD